MITMRFQIPTLTMIALTSSIQKYLLGNLRRKIQWRGVTALRQTAYLSNKKGVTLVEVMISLVILLFVFMGLIQASLVSINSNLRNEIRDAAAGIAAENMARAKSMSIDLLTAQFCPAAPANTTTVSRQIRSAIQPFFVTGTCVFPDANSAQVTVSVAYTVSGDTATTGTQTINSLVRRP
ncbi:MAG: hypothetical protein C0402_01715 [Thermodesulfovibrio sp.]|nr:hypothetical protein [Thermodesulfovibrio sp.]